MSDNPRIEDLRRRVQKDPASIAFAQLAEEYRRAGLYQESVEACMAGLERHPGYLSARVTLGRALIELGQLDEAQRELELVLKSAPENLAAIRGLAEIHHKRGDLDEALTQYKAALAIARNDPDLDQIVTDLTRKLSPQKRPELENGLSFEQMRQELSIHVPPPPVPVGPSFSSGDAESPVGPSFSSGDPAMGESSRRSATSGSEAPELKLGPTCDAPLNLEPEDDGRYDLAVVPVDQEISGVDAAESFAASDKALNSMLETIPDPSPAPEIAVTARLSDAAVDEKAALARQTVAALEQWLAAIHVARAQRRT